MNKIATYLQEHVVGEVTDSSPTRQHFSTDSGLLEVNPSLIVYPSDINDIRKTMRFVWQLAEKKHGLPVTARGFGSNQASSAIGQGVVMVFAAHMKRLLEFDAKQRLVRVQPGISCAMVQETIKIHKLLMPACPEPAELSTVGGLIAERSLGKKAAKYGLARQSVESLEVVLANGELIQTERLNRHDLNRKKGLTNLEGEIYRQIDNLITDNKDLLKHYSEWQGGGYALSEVKHRDGSFDLTPLFVGSEGTLGVISEVILKLEEFNPHKTVIAAYFNDLESACQAVASIIALKPSVLEVIDKHLFDQVERMNPARLKGVVDATNPAAVILVEFDDEHKQTSKVKKAQKILAKLSEHHVKAEDPIEQDRLWAIRLNASDVTMNSSDDSKAIPVISNDIVLPESLLDFMNAIYALIDKYNLQAVFWMSMGKDNLAKVHLQPMLNFGKVGDRQKVFKFMDEYYDMLLKMGGNLAGGSDGRMRATYLPDSLGPEMYQLMCDVKHIFDPYNMLNPGVKIDSSKEQMVTSLRREYLPSSYDYLT